MQICQKQKKTRIRRLYPSNMLQQLALLNERVLMHEEVRGSESPGCFYSPRTSSRQRAVQPLASQRQWRSDATSCHILLEASSAIRPAQESPCRRRFRANAAKVGPAGSCGCAGSNAVCSCLREKQIPAKQTD